MPLFALYAPQAQTQQIPLRHRIFRYSNARFGDGGRQQHSLRVVSEHVVTHCGVGAPQFCDSVNGKAHCPAAGGAAGWQNQRYLHFARAGRGER